MTISDEQVAKEISVAMQDVFRRLEQSLIVVRERCNEEEVKVYTQRVGDLFYNVVFKMIEPLYFQHPELRPDGWDDRPPMDPG